MTARRAATASGQAVTFRVNGGQLLELALFLALVFSFIWGWAHSFDRSRQLVLVLGLGMTLTAHLRHRERPSDLGLRLDNLGPALRDAAVPMVPLVLVLGLRGWWLGHWRAEALSPERFAELLAWGFFQQYLLQGYIHRRLMAVIPSGAWRAVAVGLIFAALHIPNPVLVPATFAAGWVFALLFWRHPNLFVLALCHAVGSTAVAFAFDPDVLHRMRVGPGYFRL
jgi:membrane protease YdiL (CAAX protease family)